MPPTELATRFVTLVASQRIFNTLISTESRNLPGHPLLVVRQNRDLFYAYENLVRCCAVNPNTSNYRLLLTSYATFRIRALALNPTGSLLAAVGEHDIVVYTLPTSLTTTNIYEFAHASFAFLSFSGSITQALWHPAVARDCGLVVLTSTLKICVYDLLVSQAVPQMTLDLTSYESFKNRTARSICFGSNDALSGALTLYVTSDDGKVFAVYPFVHVNGTIRTSKSQVNALVEETRAMADFVAKLPSLSASLEAQLRLVNTLKKSADHSSCDDEIPLVFPQQNLPDIQGPLHTPKGFQITDILQVNSNEKIPLFAALTLDHANQPSLSFYAQLKPLMMRWKSMSLLFAAPSSPKKPTGYIKPKRGFGYIDLSEDSDEDEGTRYEEVSRRLTEEFGTVTLLAVDKLPNLDTSCVQLVSLTKSSFAIIDKTNLLVTDSSDWCASLSSNAVDFNELQIDNRYHSVKLTGSDTNPSVAVIKDLTMDTGNYLIIVETTQKDNLRVLQLKNNDVTHPTKKEKAKLSDDTSSAAKYESVLASEPFDQLQVSLKSILATPLLRSVVESGLLKAPVKNDNPEVLTSITTLSESTLKQAAAMTAYVILLHFRFSTQVEELKGQIAEYKRIDSGKASAKGIDEANKRISAAVERQQKLTERGKALQEKLISSIETIRHEKALPLSDAERLWFKEINSINTKLNHDNIEGKSFVGITDTLRSQVRAIVDNLGQPKSVPKDDDGTADVAAKLKDLQIGQNISKLKQWLLEEAQTIDVVKSRLEKNHAKMELIT